jgi:hypothetical protein
MLRRTEKWKAVTFANTLFAFEGSGVIANPLFPAYCWDRRPPFRIAADGHAQDFGKLYKLFLMSRLV